MGERVELVNGEVCDDERLNSENGVCLTCSAGGRRAVDRGQVVKGSFQQVKSRRCPYRWATAWEKTR